MVSGADEKIVYLSPVFKADLGNTAYHGFADEGHFWIQRRFELLTSMVSRDDLGESVMEIGCGRGVTSRLIEAHYGVRLAGCDIDEEALRSAAGAGGRFFYDISTTRPEWKGHFSTIFLLDVLEHIKNPVDFLKAAGFHLKNGGLLLINVPAQQCLYSVYDSAQGHVKRYGRRLLRDELAKAGFAVVKESYWGMTMIPFLAVRKLMLRFIRAADPIRAGFEPATRQINNFLDALLKFELRRIPANRPCGTSLMVLARK